LQIANCRFQTPTTSAASICNLQSAICNLQSAIPLNILVAEDNELSAQVLEQVVLRHGHRARLATNGKEALALAETGEFDILLLDVHMPEMDGFQVVQAIREREPTVGGRLPVIALTARSRKEDRERCIAAGMDDFLTKPVRPADLWEAVDRVLRAGPPHHALSPDLLDAPVLLAACGGDPNLLAKMCQSLRERIPEHLAAIRTAFRDHDSLRLREAAHKFCGLLSEFSTVAGDLAGNLEDLAAGAQLEKASPIVEKLEVIAEELVGQIDALSIESLKKRAGTRNDPDRTGHS
jgi:two-component system, sensor histidine kinase and response regulator